jgi:hypothetical protein
MTSPTLIALYLAVGVVLMKVLAAANLPRPTCARCALPRERRRAGEPVCRCRH